MITGANTITPTDPLNRYVVLGVAASILLHIVLFFTLSKDPPRPATGIPMFVEIIQEQRPAIVSPPDAPADTTEAPTNQPRYQSEKTVTVKEQMIKRGEPDAGIPGERAPQKPKQQPQQQPKEPSQPVSKSAPQKLSPKDLKLDSRTMLREFTDLEKKPVKSADLDNSITDAPASYSPFSRPIGAGAAFLGGGGVNDYLPNLPDGDLTLLNTKANQYAVFVRRVATKVFAALRSEGWEVLRGRDIRDIRDFAVVRATMSKAGDLLGVTIQSNSGNQRFDDVLLSSARIGTKDPNPPEGAQAADGKIHFIFKSRAWSSGYNHPRTGAPTERRWVLLGTGLE